MPLVVGSAGQVQPTCGASCRQFFYFIIVKTFLDGKCVL